MDPALARMLLPDENQSWYVGYSGGWVVGSELEFMDYIAGKRQINTVEVERDGKLVRVSRLTKSYTQRLRSFPSSVMVQRGPANYTPPMFQHPQYQDVRLRQG